MKLSPQALFAPVLAVLVLAVVLQQTSGALRASGSWQVRTRSPRAVTEDPYTRIDDLLGGQRTDLHAESIRNPFAFGAARPVTPVATKPSKSAPPVAVTPAAPARPTLTSIIYDADPRATVRYNGVDYSVRVNSLFADFTVKNITANEVTLDRNGETIVLGLRSKGD